MTDPTLQTPRLALTLPNPQDVPELLDYVKRNDAFHDPWSPPKPPNAFALDTLTRAIIDSRRQYVAGTKLRLYLRAREEPRGRIIGIVTLANIERGNYLGCVLGYSIDEAHQGKGYMTEAVREVVRHAFDVLELHRIEASYLPTNERSGRLLRRLGFVVEGYARDYRYVGGSFKDHILTSLTNHELADVDRLCTPRG